MGRAPCCDKANVKKGPWSPEEDLKLKEYIEKYGTGGNWIALPQKAGLRRCGKSCRLRWLNYLRPNIKHGEFSDDEDRIICTLFASIGSRWSIIAAQLPGRTDNDIKNYWNTKLKKKLMSMVVQLQPTHERKPHQLSGTFSSLLHSCSSSSPISSALSTSSSAYKFNNNSYYSQVNSFTNLDQTPSISIPSILDHQSQPQEGFVGPMQNYYQVKDTLLTYGGDHQHQHQASSTSSEDVSSTNGEQMGLQNYFYTNGAQEDHKFMVSNNGTTTTTGGVNGGWSEQKPNGVWGNIEAPLMDYGFEEIKQLISTNICNNFFVDENKTEERVMMYY